MLENILNGYRVIDLTQNVAGPFGTQIFGDISAEVVKIERPGSDDNTRAWRPPEAGGQSVVYLAIDRNQKSVCIDFYAAAAKPDVAQAIEHEQVKAVGMLSDLPIPGVPRHQVMALLVAMNHRRSGKLNPPPALGAHTAEVLSAIGRTTQQLEDLRRQGVIA